MVPTATLTTLIKVVDGISKVGALLLKTAVIIGVVEQVGIELQISTVK